MVHAPGLIARHVAMELAKVFLVVLTASTFLLTVVGVAQEALRQGITPLIVLRLLPFALPNALAYAVPATTLFSVCSVFGRMSSANEIIARKIVRHFVEHRDSPSDFLRGRSQSRDGVARRPRLYVGLLRHGARGPDLDGGSRLRRAANPAEL